VATTLAAVFCALPSQAQPSPDNEAYPLAQRNVAPDFPVHGSLEVDNAFGGSWLVSIGSLAPNVYAPAGSWRTILRPLFSLTTPRRGWWPPTTLRTRFGVGVQWPLGPYQQIFNAVPRLSDWGTTLSMPRVLRERVTNISVTPVAMTSLPLSLRSRMEGRLATVGGRVEIQWDTTALPLSDVWGDVGVSLAPSVSAPFYALSPAAVRCGSPSGSAGIVQLNPTGDPSQRLEDQAIVVPRAEYDAVSGECIRPGRQTLGSYALPLRVEWFLAGHSVAATLTFGGAFLRPISSPELTQDFSSGQAFTQATRGSLAYRYRLPFTALGFDIPGAASIAVGTTSIQPAWTADGKYLRFPFWDFISPQNNFSAAFLTLGIDA
jgi:hypothetical protein